MRSGFIAGDSELIEKFFRYRTYHGCAMAPYTQAASIRCWRDETHVIKNREQYREKFDAVMPILKPALDLTPPDAGFYLWPETPVSDLDFARELYGKYHITVLPGRFLSRETAGVNPGAGRIRIALVASLEECREAAKCMVNLIKNLS